MYKNICLRCHPGGGAKKESLDNQVLTPAVYIGETSRSLFERGREHWKAFHEKRENSHILKHHILHHGGEGEPKFHLRPLSFHKTALNRQLSEAVKIGRVGEDNLLNSKGEYNRSHIARLTLEKPMKKKAVDAVKEDYRPKEGEEDEDDEEEMKRKTTKDEENEDNLSKEDLVGKKLKYNLIEEGCWGRI